MTYRARTTAAATRRAAWAIGLAVALSAGLAAAPAAQESGGRLNRIIEQFEAGEAALANEHWRIVSLEHNPFLVDDLEAFLGELVEQGGARPRLTPIVRIPHEADQAYHHVVKQILDAGAMGIVLPQVRTAAEIDHARARHAVSPAGRRRASRAARPARLGADGRAAGLEHGQRRVCAPR